MVVKIILLVENLKLYDNANIFDDKKLRT